MSLYTRITIWSEGQILSANDLNTEFNNDILNGPPNHASQHASGGVDDIKAYFLSLSAGGTVAAAVTFSAASSIILATKINENKGSDIVAASTTDIGAATGNFIDVTGNTAITALGTIQAGTRRIVRFTGTPTLTHNGTSLILPGAANIVVAANDIATFLSLGTGNWVCESYQRAVNPPYVQSATPAANTVPVRNAAANLPFRGALTKRITSSFSLSGATPIQFNGEAYDSDTIHDNATNPSRLTVPTGITKVRLLWAYSITGTSLSGSSPAQTLTKNGVAFLGSPYHPQTIASTLISGFGVSPIITVTTGDYFEVIVNVTGTSPVIPADDNSWFAMEIVE